MKNIWLISYQLDGVTAGPSIRFQRYAPFFMEKGYRLCIVTKRINQSFPEYEKRRDFDIVRIVVNHKRLNHTVFIFKALLSALNNRNKINTVLTFSLTTFSLLLVLCFKIVKLPLYYVNTMALDKDLLKSRNLASRLYNLLHFYLYKILYSNISGIIASTEYLLAYFHPYKINKNKLIKIYNGVNCNTFCPVDEKTKIEIRNKLTLPNDRLIFLFVGLKTERKGLQDLLNTWDTWPYSSQCLLLLIGDEKPEANTTAFNDFWCRYRSNSLENKNVVNLNNQNNISEYFKASDCFLFLSQKEGMPNVLLEALSCGLPTILTTFEGYSNDYGTDGEHFYIVERNQAAIINVIDKIYFDKDNPKKIGLNSAERMKNIFDVSNSIAKYVELFNDSSTDNLVISN